MYDIPQTSNKKRKKDKINDSVRLSKLLNFNTLSKYNDDTTSGGAQQNIENAVTP